MPKYSASCIVCGDLMKKTVFYTFAVLLCCFCALSASAAGHAPDAAALQKEKDRFTLEKAAGNVAENSSVLGLLYKENADHSAWYTIIADALPSQPVAVIKLLAFTQAPVAAVCPRPSYNASQGHLLKPWMRRTVAALDSFTMKEPAEEAVRRACLDAVTKALAE